MKLYTYDKCGTCKKAKKWLDDRGVPYDEIPIRDRPPSKRELRAMLGHLGGDPKKLFNTSGKDYRASNIKSRLPDMSEAEVIDLLAGNGNLIKRPFLLAEGFGAVGFREDAYERALTRDRDPRPGAGPRPGTR